MLVTMVNFHNVLDEGLGIEGRVRQMNSKVKDRRNMVFIATKLVLQT
jgi:hypothetical protein